VALGGHPVRMVLDTGASSSVISPTLANNLIQWGHAHWLGKSKSVLADGRVIDVGNISINEVHIGNNVLHDVRALVNQSDEGSMLLGLETLNQIGPFTVDISKGELRFNPKGA
jgi:clan AA aspartic protease (TIGR02281 family)